MASTIKNDSPRPPALCHEWAHPLPITNLKKREQLDRYAKGYLDCVVYVDGIKFIEWGERRETCIDEVLKEERGYHDPDKNGGDFLVSPSQVIVELGKFDYKPIEQPKPGSVIVYFKRDSFSAVATHYAKVDSVAKDAISVISKFGEGNVYRHPWDTVFTSFGDQVLFFNKEASSADEKSPS